MAGTDRIQQEKQNTEEEITLSRGAVFIKDPKKRRKCPLCRQNMFLYNLNFDEMFLMCENSYCDYPFGYEALQIVQDESQLIDNPVKATKDFFEYPTPNVVALHSDSILNAGTCTISSMSMSGLSECDRLSQISDPEDLTLDKQEMLASSLSRQEIKKKHKLLQNKEVQNSLDRIKQLTEELKQLQESTEKDSKTIKNKKWLRNLKKWEGSSGLKLLNDKEHVEFDRSETEMVKISLEPTTNENTSAVNISIFMDTTKAELNITEQVSTNSMNEVDNANNRFADNYQNKEKSSIQKFTHNNCVTKETRNGENKNNTETEEKSQNTMNSSTEVVSHAKTDWKGEGSNMTEDIGQEDNNMECAEHAGKGKD